MAATERDSGCAIPICTEQDCQTDATAVIAYPSSEAIPYCDDHTTDKLDAGGREYPLEEYYPLGSGHVNAYADPAGETFELAARGNQYAWLTADNVASPGSSVYLDDTQTIEQL